MCPSLGCERDDVPDFLADVDDGHGQDDLLHLIIEVTGEHRPERVAKIRTVREQQRRLNLDATNALRLKPRAIIVKSAEADWEDGDDSAVE